MCMPLFIALYLNAVGGVVLFVDVAQFQVTMWCLFVASLAIWLVLGLFVFRQQFYMWHILPTSNHFQVPAGISASRDGKVSLLKEYEQIHIYPIVEKLMSMTFPADIARVVLDYFECIQLDD